MTAKELADKKRFLLVETKKVKEIGDLAKSLEEKGALKKTCIFRLNISFQL